MNKSASLLVFSVFCVVLLGLLMVFNTTSAEALGVEGKEFHHALLKQVLFAILGLAIAYGVYIVDYHTLLKLSPYFFWGGCVLLSLVLVPGVGQKINGARRWIGVGRLSIQPSEFMKCAIPMYFIYFFTSQSKTLVLKQFLVILSVLSLPILLVLFEPDNGTAAIMLSTILAMFYLAKVRWVFWGLPIITFGTLAMTFSSKMKHVADRIRIYLNPEMDLLGKGHQPYQAKIAAGSGKLFGKGLGESLQKFSYLPEARSDYIAAIFGEEFGFIGTFLIVIIYMAITYLGLKIASNAKDKQGFYLAAIFTFLISFQAFLNLGVVSGLLPSKGTNLPFFSHGGSSLMANFLCLSMILNVAKFNPDKKRKNSLA